MSGTARTTSNRHFRHRFWWRAFHRTLAVSALLFLSAEVALVAVSSLKPSRAQAAAPAGEGFTVTAGDLHFILKQIQIAEHHSATQTASNLCGTLVGPAPDQIPDRLTSYGLRTVDGSCNNLFPDREHFGGADEPFPRLSTSKFRDAEGSPANLFAPNTPAGPPTSYNTVPSTDVFDSQPRTISNLIVDQTSTNPAAVAAAEFPVRTQQNPGLFPCTTDPDPTANPPVVGVPKDCVPSHKTLFIPNVTTDVGLSPPYNSMFTFFGQFFDHGVDQTVKSGKTVFVPLKPDDPLITLGPDGKPNTGDEVPAGQRFMVLTRAQNGPGPDGLLGTADDTRDATNTDSPWVDQSQTYTSHPSHQVFLREYIDGTDGKPVATGKLLGGLPAGQTYSGSPDGTSGMATWASVKKQAAAVLGLQLVDRDVTDIPMLATDPYGKFLPGPARGLPQYVTKAKDANGNPVLVEGDTAHPVPVPSNVVHFDTPFLTDIAHNADPSPQDVDNDPRTPPVAPVPDADNTPSADFAHQPPGTYDDEMLNAHFTAGDGRVNENIALTTIHQIFHSEHDRLVTDIDHTLSTDPDVSAADKLAWHKAAAPTVDNPSPYNYGERLFQAARFVTEMEYQHLVFEEFARKVQPAIRPFHVYSPDVNPAIPAEFAHAVYRFGHSMLDDDVARTNVDPVSGAKSDNSVPLLTAFLNPPEYFNGHAAGTLTPEQAAGSIVMGSSDQVGNELDEFVTETLRNNLLGLPLDLPTINMARAREAGVPPLNSLRREIFAKTGDAQLTPYTDWSDFGQHLKHPESLINFVAAYGKHPSITSEDTLAGKRAAAKAIVDPTADPATPTAKIPADAADFMFGTGAWKNNANGVTTTGVDDIDLWVGGLAEVTNLNGGLLGSTFNYVFQNTLENLQDNDRLYYLARTPGMNLRTQLEGNSFSELIERNTEGTSTLKADAFATADCKFELSNLLGTPAGFGSFGATVADDPASDCKENLLLLRKPDGTIQYRARNTVDPPGINGQAVYNGTPGDDRILGGNDNDTFWGGAGNDVIDGQGGDDIALGGDGNDIITDLDGADTPKGGPGNDAIAAGPGDDIPMGGSGKDFIDAGANDNETFAGPGDDFIIAGQGADAVFGDGGDDWIEGGSGQDLLQGDHGAPFFDDPAEQKPGNDIFVGQSGENDYDTEGGDDVMAQNAAIDRNAGAGGFDWAFHQYDTVGGDDDMQINQQLAGLPLPIVVNRDRWQETEADSGSKFDDVIKGDDAVPSTVGGAGFTGCDALDPAGIARIHGLAGLLPATLPTPLSTVEGVAATGVCPLDGDPSTTAHDGNVWAEGNILLGGGGSDTITGRGGDDIIDGDKALSVRISVRTNPDDATTETGTTDLMENKPTSGTFGDGTILPGPDGILANDPATAVDESADNVPMTLEQAVLAGKVDPGNLVAVREILPPASGDTGVDTAEFLAPRSSYDVSVAANGTVTVNQTGPLAPAVGTTPKQKVSDGIDTLRGIEKLKFSDQTVTIAPTATLSATSLTFGSRVVGATTPAAQTLPVTVTNSGVSPLVFTGAPAITGTNAGDFTVSANTCTGSVATTCTVTVRFNPLAAGASRTGTLTLTDNAGGATDAKQTIALSGSATAAPAQQPATGTPLITPNAARTLQALNATIGSVVDPNGIRSVQFRWYRLVPNAATFPTTPFQTTNDTTTPFTSSVIAAQCTAYKVGVIVTDNLGHVETTELMSAPTTRATLLANGVGCAGQPLPLVVRAASAPAITPLGQATAPLALRAPLVAGAVSVSASANAPLAVSTTVPAGASTVAISVFRLNSGLTRSSKTRHKASTVHVATVYRKVGTAKRYVFRLTERKLRNLKPGRYLVEVRVGASRQSLGPAKGRIVTIRRGRATSAR
jgi:Ca2+-binding RTX toxin-like protein